MVRFKESLAQLLIECGSEVRDVVAHRIQTGPIGRLIAGQPSPDWIDAKGKQPVEIGMETLQMKQDVMKQIPIERLQVPNIKNNPMAFWNRPIIEGRDAEQAEEFVASLACIGHALHEPGCGSGFILGGKHSSLLIWPRR